MNKLLAEWLGYLNAVIAIIIIISGGLINSFPYRDNLSSDDAAIHLIIGIFVGMIVATIICGLLAVIIAIKQSMQEISQTLYEIGFLYKTLNFIDKSLEEIQE